MVFTRNAREAASGTTINDHNWGIRKIRKCESEVISELKAQIRALVYESSANSSEGVVSQNTTIPASQIEGLLSMKSNFNWDCQSPNCDYNNLNVTHKGKRKRSSRSKC